MFDWSKEKLLKGYAGGADQELARALELLAESVHARQRLPCTPALHFERDNRPS